MSYQYSPAELAVYRNNPDRRMPAPIGQTGTTYAQYMSRNAGGGAGATPADWLAADNARKEAQRVEDAKPSQALTALYNQRSYTRGLFDNYGKTALSDEARNTAQAKGQLGDSLRSRGLYNTTVTDAMTTRLNEASSRARGAIQEQIATAKYGAESSVDNRIADQLSHEADVKANFIGQAAAGNAQAHAQETSSLIAGGASIAGLAAMAAILM